MVHYFIACVNFDLNFAFLMTRDHFGSEVDFLSLKSLADEWWYAVTHPPTGFTIPNLDFFIGIDDRDYNSEELMRIYGDKETRLYSTNPLHFLPV